MVKRHDFSEGFHTYGIEWSKDYLYTYIDNPLQQVLYVDFKSLVNMWTWGQFQGRLENGTSLRNPWFTSENSNAPFDQKFYLILNVAVGSHNGWFPYVLFLSLEGSPVHVANLYQTETLSATNHGIMQRTLQNLISTQVSSILKHHHSSHI
jgi:hypothetical protein